MKRKGLDRIGILLVIIALAVVWQGCDIFGPDKEPPKEDPVPPMPPRTPQDVIDNLEYAYNRFDYNKYYPLIRDDFWFIFDDKDHGAPGVPQEGVWGQSDELLSAKNMLDPDFNPSDETYKIESMQLLINVSTKLDTTNVMEAPPGTLAGYVTFDLTVELTGGEGAADKLLVRSRPEFYFAPDDTAAAQKIWRLWRIKDAEYDED